MKRRIFNFVFLISALFSICICTLSCEVGLGASVDTERPNLAITYPPKGSIVMGTFGLAGTVADDIGVSYVNVVLTNKTTGQEFVYSSKEGSVIIETPSKGWSKGTTWSAKINKKETGKVQYNGWDLPDGEYFIDVEAFDGVGSVYDRRKITIDNTPPVFIVNNLTSLGAETDLSKISTFGQKINLTGKAYDESDISKVFFTVYDENYKELGSEEIEYDMTSEGLVLAQYKLNPSDEKQKALAKNFNMIYGLNENESLPEDNEVKSRYLVITLADNARIYDSPVYENEDAEGVTGFDGRGNGNLSTEIYLNTQPFSLQNITIDDLSVYKRRIAEYPDLEKKLSIVSSNSIANVLVNGGTDFSKVTKLQINPDIDPKWYLSGYEKNGSDFNQAFLGTPLSVMFVCGNDNVEFKPENIRIVLARVVEENGKYNKIAASEIALREQASDNDDVIILKDYGEGGDKMESSYTASVSLSSPYLKIPNRYQLFVFGKDGFAGDGRDFTGKEGEYGIKAVTTAKAPEISVKDESDQWIGPDTQSFPLNFTIGTDGERIKEGYPKVTVAVKDSNGVYTDELNGKFLFECGVPEEESSSETKLFKYNGVLRNIEGGKLPLPSTNGSYLYEVTIEAQDKADGYSSVVYRINADKVLPEIKVDNVKPYIDGGFINGTVEIPVVITDKNGIKEAGYKIIWGSGDESGKITLDDKGKGKITVNTLNSNGTQKVPDDTTIVIEIDAEDNYGNKYENGNLIRKTYIVNQESDRPVMEFGNLVSTERTSFSLKNSNVKLTVSDDDGVDKLEVKIWGINSVTNAQTLISDWSELDIPESNSVNANFFELGKIIKDGKYKLQFKLTDKIGNLPTSSNESEVFEILVDGTSPVFDKTYGYEGSKVFVDEKEISKIDKKFYVGKGATAKISVRLIEGNIKTVKEDNNVLTKGIDYVLDENSLSDWIVSVNKVASNETDIVFEAEDEAGMKGSTTVKLFFDNEDPVIEEPLLSKFVKEENNDKKYIYGVVSINGKVSDNDKVNAIKVTLTDENGRSKNFDIEINELKKTKSFVLENINTNDFSEGKLVLTIEAEDLAGNTSKVFYDYYIDQTKDKPILSYNTEKINPELKNSLSVEAQANTEKNILGKQRNNEIKITAKDNDGNCTVVVEAFKESDIDILVANKEFSGKESYSCFINDLGITEDGNYIIKVTAKDSISRTNWTESTKGNGTTSEKFCIVVDGDAPKFNNIKIEKNLELTEPTVEVYNGNEAFINGTVNIVFDVVEMHLSTLTAKVGNLSAINIKDNLINGKAVYSFNPSELTLPQNVITPVQFCAVDATGFETIQTVNLYYDTKAPIITDPNVSPAPDGNDKYVNGIINISGNIAENFIDTINVSIFDKTGNEKTSVTVEDTNEYSVPQFDTTKVEDGKLTVKVTAYDKAGNKTENIFEYKVDQTKDAPQISPTGFAENIAGSEVQDNKNLFVSGSILEAHVTDDDGIDTVTIQYRDSEEKEFISASEVSFVNNTLKWNLPKEESKYQILITAVDTKKETVNATKQLKTWIGVTSGSPVISINNKPDSEYVSGIVGHETRVEIPLKYKVGATTKLKREISVQGTDGAYVSTDYPSLTKNYTDKEVSDFIEASCKAGENATVKITYTVINDFGQSDTADYVYVLDNKKPAFDKMYVGDGVNKKEYVANKWSGVSNFTLNGIWNEDGSGLKELEYYIVDSLLEGNPSGTPTGKLSAFPSAENGKWEFKQVINGFQNGTNYIYIRAIDKAGNTSDFSNFNLNLDTTPPELSLSDEMNFINNSLYVNSQTLESGTGAVVKGTLEDKVSFINAWQAVAVFAGSGPIEEYPKWKVLTEDEVPLYDYKVNYVDNLTSKVTVYGLVAPSNLIGFAGTLGEDYNAQDKKKDFNIKIDSSNLEKVSGKYKAEGYQITVIGSDWVEKTDKKSFTLYVDDEKPKVKNLNISKRISDKVTLAGTQTEETRDDNVNGVITISADVTDNKYVKKTEIQVYGNINQAPIETIPLSEEEKTSFTKTLDTNRNIYADKNVYTVKIVSTDYAGNPSNEVITFCVNSDTDKPKVSFSNNESLFGLGKWEIFGTAEDDDGVNSVTVYKKDDSATNKCGTKLADVYSLSEGSTGQTSVSLKYEIPHTDENSNVAGDQNVIVEIEDIYGTKAYTDLSYKVDNEAPKFDSLTVNENAYSENVCVQGRETTKKGVVILISVSDDIEVEKLEYKEEDSWRNEKITLQSTDGKTRIYKYTDSTADGVISKVFRVTDKYNRYSEKTLNFIVDSDNPVFTASNLIIKDSEGTVSTGENWLRSKTIKLETKEGGYIAQDTNLSSTVEIKVGGESGNIEMTLSSDKTKGQIKTSRSFSDGISSISLTFKDKAGRKNTATPITVKVDSEEPEVKNGSLSMTEKDISKAVPAGKIKVSFSANDKTSGIEAAYIGTKSKFETKDALYKWENLSVESGKDKEFKYEIDTTSWGSGSYDIYVRVQDIAGNLSNDFVGTFVLDKEDPVVTFDSVRDADESITATGIQVNGTITVSGKADDAHPGEKVNLKVQKNGEETDLVTKTGLILDSNSSFDSWSFVVDTTKLDDGKYDFIITAIDEAGNEVSKNQTLEIKQDTDRPLINFKNINPNESKNSTLRTSLLEGRIYGTITDDDWRNPEDIPSGASEDGTEPSLSIVQVQKLEIMLSRMVENRNGIEEEKSLSEWQQLLLKNGTEWEYTVNKDDFGAESLDGEYTVSFRVTDNDGNEYETSGETNKPRLQFNGSGEITDDSFKFAIDANLPYFDSVNPVQIQFGETEPLKLMNGMKLGGSGVTDDDRISNRKVGKIIVNVEDKLTSKNNLNVVLSISGSGNEFRTVDVGKGTSTKEVELDFSDIFGDSTKYSGYIMLTVSVDEGTTPVIKEYDLIVDNEAPETIENTTFDLNEELSGDIRITGNASDGTSALTKLRYVIPPRNKGASEPASVTEETAGDFNWISQTEEGQETSLRYAANFWEINFDNLTDPDSPSKINPAFAGWEDPDRDEIYLLPVWFELTDELGNIGYVTDPKNKILFNPNADKPKIVVTSPVPGENADSIPANASLFAGEKYVVLGGTIIISGTATDNEGVAAVYIQYDVNGDGEFDITDKTWLSTVTSSKGNKLFEVVDSIPGSEGNPDDWGIKVDGTLSWQATFDATVLMTATSGNGGIDYSDSPLQVTTGNNKTLNYRVRATDTDRNNQLASSWSKPAHISLNDEFPEFSQFELKKYENGDLVKTMPYKNGAFIGTGNWFLEGYVIDDNGIKESSVSESIRNGIKTEQGKTGYNLKIPVPNTISDPKEFNYSLTVKDNGDAGSEKTSTVKFRVRIDTDNPVFKDNDETGSDLAVYIRSLNNENELSGTVKIQNENGLNAVFLSKVDDRDGSGFEKAIVFFERYDALRTGKSNTKANHVVYNVRKENEAISVSSIEPATEPEDGSVYIKDGLPVMKVKSTTDESVSASANPVLKKNSNTSVTVYQTNIGKNVDSSQDKYDSIHPGMPVLINGNYIRITKVEKKTDNSITVELADQVSSDISKAYFVMGIMVDASGEDENLDSDNDGIIEDMTQKGSVVTWSAAFNSQNIPDGPVEMHVVVFDYAGNKASGSIVSFASNHAPRITSVKLGTDLNGDGDIEEDDNEYTQFYAVKNQEGNPITGRGLEVWNLNTKAETENGGKIWTIKKNFKIIPEFVGGNGDIYYVYDKKLESAWDRSDLNGPDSTTGSDENKWDKENPSISVTTDSELESDADTEKDIIYKFSFWDSTDLSTVGTNSGWTVLNVTVKQDEIDDTDPTSIMDKFYWKGLNDNSIYGSGSKDEGGNYTVTSTKNLAGHIELEDDLTAELGASAYDEGYKGYKFTVGAPKVSGKITITGTVYDDKRLSAIKLSAGSDFTFTGIGSNDTVITFTNGVPSDAVGDFENNGWHFEVTKNELSQAGHTVDWKLDLDTEKINGPDKVKKGFIVTVTAVDAKSEESEASVSKTNAGTKTMDVVPYITGVSTYLSDISSSYPTAYSRTARGHYPVRAKATNAASSTVTGETVKLTGFNMRDASVSVETLSSGAYNHFVGEIPAVNNLNDNDAHGYAEELNVLEAGFGVCTNFNNGYNRQANEKNNNNLTDDVIFDVWEVNNRAALPKNGLLTGVKMKINPKNDLIQYAFANGGKYFSMARFDAVEPDNNNSSNFWIQGYDTFQPTSVAFHVDSTGRTFATCNGGDTNSNQCPDYFELLSSQFGVSTANGAADNNLAGKVSAICLERTAQRNGSSLVYKNNAWSGETRDMDKQRIQSVSMATSNDAANFYMAYYDNINDEIRFRAGIFPEKNEGFGMFKDLPTGDNATDYYNLTDCQIIAKSKDTIKTYVKNANDTKVTTETTEAISGRGAGRYVSIGVTQNASNQDVVCAVWYDRDAKALKYSYIEDPLGKLDNIMGKAAAEEWSQARTLMYNGGTDCQIAVDAQNHIHIAAYGGNGDLYYFYMDTFSSNPQKCLVDSMDTVGGHLTIDVALQDTGNGTLKPVPYIGYYNQSQKKAKYAYLVNTADETHAPAGVVNNMFTGSWEVTTVPTDSRLIMNTEEKINVGVWKEDGTNDTTNGKLKSSTYGTSNNDMAGNNGYNRSITYGNGTANGVLAYQIANGAGSCLETVQMRNNYRTQ